MGSEMCIRDSLYTMSESFIRNAESEIQQLLNTDLTAAIDELNSQYSYESVYSVVVYCATGFTSMGLGFNTLEWLSEKVASNTKVPSNIDTEEYLELHASQWKKLNFAYEKFNDVNKRLDTLFDEFYEADCSDEQIYEFFTKIVSQSILSADIRNSINTVFKDELLLGLQFGDPSPQDWQAALDVSSLVNSAEWHSRLESLVQ